MKFKIFTIMLAILIAFCFDANAQNTSIDPLSRAISADVQINIRAGSSNGRNFVRNRLDNTEFVDYQPYLYEDPMYGNIYLINGDTVTGSFFYNLETESLEAAVGDSVIDWSVVHKFEFTDYEKDKKYSYSNLKIIWPESEFGGFVQDVESSSLVKVKPYLEYIPKSWDPATQMGDKKDKVVPKEERYLKVDDKWVIIPDTKTAFFDMFGVYSEPLRKYARKNKLKIKDVEDIGKMVTWVARNRR